MKKRIKIKKSKEGKQATKTLSEKRIRLPKIFRLTIIGVIAIILLFSIISAYGAYNKQETTTKIIETLNYNHYGYFNYKVYLKNNTVYGGREYLNPGEGKYFRKIVDHINASFSYTFYINKTATITGSYSLIAEIQSTLWTKQYTLIPNTQINANGRSLNFTQEFPIDYQYYGGIVTQIDQETGITTSSPSLILKFNIFLNANVEGQSLIQSFTPSINVSLSGNTIDISEVLSNSQSGRNTDSQEIFHQEVLSERNKWMAVSCLLLILLVVSILVTRSDVKKLSIMEKTVKKIMKKHGEWIVGVNAAPGREGSDVIHVNSIDDLMKISEELGKPVLHYQPQSYPDGNHVFYIIDESTKYEYILKG